MSDSSSSIEDVVHLGGGRSRPGTTAIIAYVLLAALGAIFAACGGGGGNEGGGATVTAPAAPTGLQATAGNTQVALTWNSSTGATSYNVQRSTTSGGPYTSIGSPQFDSSGISSVTVTGGSVASGKNGSITITAGNTPGFCSYTIPGSDASGAAQTQSGWIVVGNPPASLTKTGDQQTGGVGATLELSVTLAPGASGGAATGAPIFFTTSAGSLAYNGTTVTMVIVPTNSSGVAGATLTLPSAPGTVTVTAEGPYGLGHPVATFAETAQ